MFFGAGNLVFPLLLGKIAGSQSVPAVCGLFITAVIFPLLGLLAMMFYNGNHRAFFGRLGVRAGLLVYAVVQILNGPAGAIPRIFMVSYGTLKPYLPEISLGIFSLIGCVIILLFVLRPSRMVDLIGAIFTPILLVALSCIIVRGLMDSSAPPVVELTAGKSFFTGLKMGYCTLDVIASFLFAELVIEKLQSDASHLSPDKARRDVIRHFFKASLIAAGLLGTIYGCLSYIAAFHVPQLDPTLKPEELLGALAVHLLGAKGALVAAVAVTMACLTTAIALTISCAEWLQRDVFRNKVRLGLPVCLTLLISYLLANLGFTRFMELLSPILFWGCPFLIGLSVVNIFLATRRKKIALR
jgi:branched-chain amino acid:cation transporter, LIVCS family